MYGRWSGFVKVVILVVFAVLAAVYLKNTVVKYWKEREAGELEENEVPFCIDDTSKAVLREHIIKAIIQTPPSIW